MQKNQKVHFHRFNQKILKVLHADYRHHKSGSSSSINKNGFFHTKRKLEN